MKDTHAFLINSLKLMAFYIPFLTNLEDKIIFKRGRICNTHFVIARNNTNRENNFSLCEFDLCASSHVYILGKKIINNIKATRIMHHAGVYMFVHSLMEIMRQEIH